MVQPEGVQRACFGYDGGHACGRGERSLKLRVQRWRRLLLLPLRDVAVIFPRGALAGVEIVCQFIDSITLHRGNLSVGKLDLEQLGYVAKPSAFVLVEYRPLFLPGEVCSITPPP